MYFREPAVAALALECGMRVSLSNAVLAFNEAAYDPETDRAIQETRALIRDFHGAGNGRIHQCNKVRIHIAEQSGDVQRNVDARVANVFYWNRFHADDL